MKLPDAREVIAVLIVGGAFGLMFYYLSTGGKLDSGTGVALVAFCGQPVAAIIGFYFGRTNGAATALAQSSNNLAVLSLQMAQQRRAGDVVVTAATVPSTTPPPPAA